MKINALLVAAVMLIAQPALAHDLAHGPNGGRVVDAGAYHVEMVVKANVVDVFLTASGDKPVPPTGFKGVAILSVGGKSERVMLQALEGTRLSGQASGALPSAPKGIVQITSPDGKSAQAKFN